MSSGSASLDADSLSRSYSVSASDRGRDNVPTRDYDGLKSQCDKAMHDLQVLRRQHSETVRRCEHTMKELEYYRGQHHAAMAQLESAAQESSSSLRPKFSDLVPDLRSSQEGETIASDALNQLYINTVTKYEAFKEEYEILRKRYDDLISSHSAAVNKLELAQEEVGRLKKQCEDMVSERNVAIRERNGLKQQCTAAIRQWDIALRERNEYQEALVKVQHQHEEAVKEINQATVVRMKANKDLKRLTEERDAAMQEYTLIMSERDSVHKEMEKLSDGLTQSLHKNKSLEAENKQLTEEKKTLTYQVETLKREITSALHDRDKALKECNDLREKFGEYTAKEESQRDSLKSRYDYREWDVGHKDLREAQSRSMDLFGKCQKERMDNLDQANQEIDRLRKQVDKIQVELQEALQEAEVCKRRRDWAFSERDKIVLERESIRTLCDKLRKERDRAVSELAQALRDSDDIKKQRNETSKQLKVLEEKMEAQLEKESRMVQLHSASNYSHDSAIDTDMQDWDTEMLVIDLNGLTSTKDIGIELVGGREDPHYPNDNGVYVASVSKGSIADGKLKINDCILRINNVDCSSVSKRFIMETMKSCGNTAVMVVRRRRLYTTQLQLNKYDHGLSLETGIFISKISPGSLASKDGNLAVGDRVIYINNRSLDGVTSAREAMALINEPNDVLTITTLKSTNTPSGFSGKQINASTQTHAHQDHHTSVYRHSPVTNLMSEASNSGPKSLESGSGFNKWRGDLKEDKKRNRNSSPVTFEQERDDAIAELDSVIDSYHPLSGSGQGTVRRRPMHADKNGGTWPKARGGPAIENNTGTIVPPRRKERLPLSLFLTSSPNYTHMCCERDPQPSRGSNTSTLDFPVKSGAVDYYVKKKGREGAGGDAHSRIHSQLYGSPHYTFTPFHPHPPHPHAHSPPPTYHLPTDSRPFCFEPPYNPLSQCHHSHAPSVDSHYHKKYSASHNSDDGEHTSFHLETGTFPRKKNNRLRINWTPQGPINPGPKVSSGSIEKSERGSPMPPSFSVEVIESSLRRPFTTSLPEYYWPHKPAPGELRRVRIDKSAEPLGIQISCLESGGVFVSTVNENSIASQVGLQVGDQLLEVCGINMRSATYKLAANVLRQCGNSITMLVQYNPEKYNELEGTGSSSSNGSKTRSGSPTPCNTPRANRKSLPAHSQLAQAISSLTQYSQSPSEEPRYLMIETHKCSNLGISLVGGNAVGIYVHSVQNGSLAYNAGLRTGDRILEYNGTDLSQATAEEAAYELAKPADKVKVRAHYCIERYNEIKDKPGDSFYIKAQFDRLGDVGDALQLKFKKDDILYVDNTMFNGVPGSWRAWLLDTDGARQQCGIIPSKYKVEEEVVRRSLGDLEGEARRATRRSFFRRKKSHQRSDSKELASFSQNFGWYSDSGTLNEDSVLASYQRVTRLNCSVLRPVLVVGPLADCVTEKLILDFPDKFARCSPEIMHCPQSAMEKGIADNLFVDYRKKGSFFECTSISAIRDMCDKNVHCIIDVGLASIERLHKQQIYPIVLLIKFKSIKQIKEVKDTTRYTVDKISAKAAKEMYEHALKLESEYKHLISTTIHASAVNIAYMCTQIKDAVHHEQLKPLWVPCSGL